MDHPDADERELERSLCDLIVVNRWLGGKRVAVRLALGLARRIASRPIRLLDVGTGSGDIPVAVAVAARSANIPVHITATDVHPRTTAFAISATSQEPAISVVSADARALPFEREEFDIAMAHTLLHHFDVSDAVVVLRELARVARWGVIVTDFERSAPALIGARLLAATIWRSHPMTRHDGPASVRAAYTVDEVAQLAQYARLSHEADVRVRSQPFFRYSLVVDRTAKERSPRKSEARG